MGSVGYNFEMIKKEVIAILLGLIVLSLYSYFRFVSIDTCTDIADGGIRQEISLPFRAASDGKKTHVFECTIRSKMQQKARLGIVVDDELIAAGINGRAIDLDVLRKRYGQQPLKDWKTGYGLSVPLEKGENLLRIEGRNISGTYGIAVRQAPQFVDYFILFILAGIPMIYGLYNLLFSRIVRSISSPDVRRIWSVLPYAIIAAGIALRLFYLVNVPNTTYQHDLQGHLEAIHYYMQHPLEMPQADKSLQFPQQPLYYWLAAAVYSVSMELGFGKDDAVFAIRTMSVVFSVFWLFLGLKIVRLVTRRRVLINVFMAFLSFTPLFVIMGAFVNNDSLNMLLGTAAVYSIVVYYKTKGIKAFVWSFVIVNLALLTKISSLLYAVFFAVVLLTMYMQDAGASRRYRRQLLFFGTSVLLVFGFSLLKVYLPATGEFRFVNSALYGNQIIPGLDLGYFFTFHWADLIEHAQATVLYTDTIRFSLPTYFYGTMFLDDHIYKALYAKGGIFKLSAQLTYLFGAMYIVGWLAYAFFFRRLGTMQKLLAVPVAINAFLIIKFLNDYWVVCNSHFRYFSPTFASVGLLWVIGLEQLRNRWPDVERVIAYVAVPFFAAQIYWTVRLVGFAS